MKTHGTTGGTADRSETTEYRIPWFNTGSLGCCLKIWAMRHWYRLTRRDPSPQAGTNQTVAGRFVEQELTVRAFHMAALESDCDDTQVTEGAIPPRIRTGDPISRPLRQ